MKELSLTNPTPSKREEKTCHAKNFYDAMTAYVNSKKTKKICEHERTFYCRGWKVCIECRLCIHKTFCQNPYDNISRYNNFTVKEDIFPKIRETTFKMMHAIIRNEEEEYYNKTPEAKLPRELLDHLKELCLKCMDLKKNVKCHIRSLCAAALWKKVKSSYPEMITLTEFSKKVGVSVPTIIKTCKTIKH